MTQPETDPNPRQPGRSTRRRAQVALLLASLLLAAVLAACGGAPPAPETRATAAEARTGLNQLLDDATAVTGGLGSSDLGEAVRNAPCLDCDTTNLIAPQIYPGVFAIMYDLDASGQPTNWRPAQGTFTYDTERAGFNYVDTPSDALVVTWPSGGETVTLRLGWRGLSEVKTTTYALPWPFDPPWDDSTRPATFMVPSGVDLTLSRGATQAVQLTLDQTWAETACGTLLEYRTLHATGQASSGTNGIELTEFSIDRRDDERFALRLEASLTSGSVTLPVSFAANVATGTVERDPLTCQVIDVEPPISGDLAASAGSGDSAASLRLGWRLQFAGPGVTNPTRLDLEDAYFTVAGKRVNVSGYVTLSPQLSFDGIRLEFGGGETASLPDFLSRFGF